MASIYAKGRDNARTPMQWDASPNGGFTTGTPWLASNPNYDRINAEQATADSDSIFHYYKRLIQLRKKHDIMVYGSYELILPDDARIYAYTRELNGERWLIILNFFGEPAEFILPDELAHASRELIISNYDDIEAPADIRQFTLRPYEARVYSLTK